MSVRRAVVAVAYTMLRVVDRFLQLVLVPHRDRICFLSIPDYTDNAYYTYRHAVLTRSDLEFVWLVGDMAVADQIRAEFEDLTGGRPGHGHRLRVERRRSLVGYLLHLRSRYTFHSQGAYAFSRWAPRRHVVNLWHGMPIKAIGHLNRVSPSRKEPFGTLQVASSQAYAYIIATAFDAPVHDVLVSGLPRCDALRFEASRATPVDQVRSRLGIPPEHRFVMWMPTYRVQSGAFVHEASRLDERRDGTRSFLDDLPSWALPALSRACVEHDCTVIVKPHPLDVINQRALDLGLPGIRFLSSPAFRETGMQLYDVLAATDGLVSDLSSVIIDYLATGRPMGLIGFDEGTYDRDLLLPMDLFRSSPRFHSLDDPGRVAAFCRDVRDGVRSSLDDALTTLVYREPDGPSAELILSEVGR